MKNLIEINDIGFYREQNAVDFIYTNNTINNTLRHANLDSDSSDEHYKRALNNEIEGNTELMEDECLETVKDGIDSIEKFLKVAANMIHVETKQFVNNRGRIEIIRNTHYITEIGKQIQYLDIVKIDDTEYLDSFTDEDNKCYTSHTALSYGNVQPTMEDAKKVIRIKNEVKSKVNKFREKVKIRESYY